MKYNSGTKPGMGDPYWYEWSVGLKYVIQMLTVGQRGCEEGWICARPGRALPAGRAPCEPRKHADPGCFCALSPTKYERMIGSTKGPPVVP